MQMISESYYQVHKQQIKAVIVTSQRPNMNTMNLKCVIFFWIEHEDLHVHPISKEASPETAIKCGLKSLIHK